jgi:hypothetical protein
MAQADEKGLDGFHHCLDCGFLLHWACVCLECSPVAYLDHFSPVNALHSEMANVLITRLNMTYAARCVSHSRGNCAFPVLRIQSVLSRSTITIHSLVSKSVDGGYALGETATENRRFSFLSSHSHDGFRNSRRRHQGGCTRRISSECADRVVAGVRCGCGQRNILFGSLAIYGVSTFCPISFRRRKTRKFSVGTSNDHFILFVTRINRCNRLRTRRERLSRMNGWGGGIEVKSRHRTASRIVLW